MTESVAVPSTSPRAGEPVARSFAFGKWEGLALVLGVVIAYMFFLRNAALPILYDAAGYAEAGRDILEQGLLSNFHDAGLRTYGFPLFLSFAIKISDLTGAALRTVVFAIHLLLYVLAAVFVRRELSFRGALLSKAVFGALVLNFYALLYTSEVLTESLSLTLLVATAGTWLWLQRTPNRFTPLVIGSAAVALAVMIRPANLFLLGSWGIGCAIIFAPRAFTTRGALTAFSRALVVIAVIAAIFAPQWLNNVRNFQRHTPLIVTDLQLAQQRWGIEFIKYATALTPPVAHPQVFYNNPFLIEFRGDDPAPLKWYLNHPLNGALTIGLHVFNMTDQDLLFTYADDLHPWFRIPHGLLNHAIMALGLLGFAMWVCTIVRQRNRAQAEAALALTVLALSNCAIYATAVVEMRFGLTVLSILFPCAAYAALRIRAMSAAGPKSAAMGFVLAYAIAALLLSGWVRNHSQQIVAAPIAAPVSE